MRLFLLLTAGILLCGVAAAQPPGAAGRREARGPLDRLGGPGAAPKPAPEPVETEPDEPAPEPSQKYDELDVTDLTKTFNSVNGILAAGNFTGEQQKTFDDYYQKFFLARWTQVQSVAKLHVFRKELRNHLNKKATGGGTAVHDHLNQLVLDFMNKLIAGNYHPAVQINAMLMIGELEDQPSKPLPEALDVMLKAVGDTKLSDAVRAAAMVGIQRHVAAGIADENVRRTVADAMLKVAAADVPAGTARTGREWILAQAIETLARLSSLGENNAAFKAMLKTVSDAKLSLYTRGMAAESLGRLNYAGAAGINPLDAAVAIGQFLSDACTEELRLAKETGKGVSRRRMKQRLSAALAALTGGDEGKLKGIALLARDPGQQSHLGELQKAIAGFIDLLDDKKHEENDLEAPVDQLRSKLDAWLKKKPK